MIFTRFTDNLLLGFLVTASLSNRHDILKALFIPRVMDVLGRSLSDSFLTDMKSVVLNSGDDEETLEETPEETPEETRRPTEKGTGSN